MATRRVLCPWCGEVDRPKDLLAAAKRTPTLVQRVLRGLTNAELFQRPAYNDWSLHDIIAHLADAEIAFGFRIRMILAEESPVIQPFDETAWAGNLDYDHRNLRILLNSFRTLRAANFELLQISAEADWARVGRHPDFGPLTLEAVWGHVIDHDLNHLRQLAETRSEAEPLGGA